MVELDYISVSHWGMFPKPIYIMGDVVITEGNWLTGEFTRKVIKPPKGKK